VAAAHARAAADAAAQLGPEAQEQELGQAEDAAADAARRQVLESRTHKSALCPHRVLVRRGDHLWGDTRGTVGRLSVTSEDCVHIVCQRGARLWGQWELDPGSGGTLCRADCRFVAAAAATAIPDPTWRVCFRVAGGPWVLERCAISLLAPPANSTEFAADAAAGDSSADADAAAPAQHRHFEAALQFAGKRAGWCFKRGRLGLGYYWDGPPGSAPPPRPAQASAAGRRRSECLRPSAVDYFTWMQERVRASMHAASEAPECAAPGATRAPAAFGEVSAGEGPLRVAAMLVSGEAELVVYRSVVSGGLRLTDECEVLLEDSHLTDTGGGRGAWRRVDGISFDGAAAGLLRRCLLTNHSRAAVGICGEGKVKAELEMCEFVGNAGCILHADYPDEFPWRFRPASLSLRRCIIRDGSALWRGDRSLSSRMRASCHPALLLPPSPSHSC